MHDSDKYPGQSAISTLPARADGAAARLGQQGRSSSERRGAVVQDAKGSKEQSSAAAPSPACTPRAVVPSDLIP